MCPSSDTTEPALAGLQAAFAEALLDSAKKTPAGLTGRSSTARRRRFGVYRNNVHASLVETLTGRFPVMQRLVGEEFFRAAAQVFIAQQPPRSPVLLEYGGAFADFLETFEPAEPLPYLPDVARLEWLRACAYHAADAEPIDPQALVRVSADRIHGVAIAFHPSVGLLASPFPVLSIWETNTHDEHVRSIGPELPGEAAFVVRRGLEVLVVRLAPGGHEFVRALSDGAALGPAAERGTAAAAEFSVEHTLAALLQAGALTDVSLAESAAAEKLRP